MTEEEISIEVKPRQYAKHFSPNEVTDGGSSIDFKPLQPLKQLLPNEVTLEGIFIEVNLSQ